MKPIKTFEEWMKEVDKLIGQRLDGFDSNDLPDCCYRDWYDRGGTPKAAAARAIKNAKGDLF